MEFFCKIHDVVLPKRYLSAWARQRKEHEDRWRQIQIHFIKEEGRRLSNRLRIAWRA